MSGRTVDILLHRLDEQITEHSLVIERHCKRFERLEQLIDEVAASSQSLNVSSVSRLAGLSSSTAASTNHPNLQSQRFDIARFSEQERRILSVFFQNRDMALSYVDIARALNKSPHTVKNQMHQINMKADLFNYSIGSENRKRFKLKDGLKIEKYLNTSRNSDRLFGPDRAD